MQPQRLALLLITLTAVIGGLFFQIKPNQNEYTHCINSTDTDFWSPLELTIVCRLSLRELAAPTTSASNQYADHKAASQLGLKLFFDPRLSHDGTTACATCHQPTHFFTDKIPLAEGLITLDRHTMTLLGAVYSPWQFWDGRKDSLWAQALEPLENAQEHASHRLHIVATIAEDEAYRADYEAIFGDLPEIPTGAVTSVGHAKKIWPTLSADTHSSITQAFVNLGKSIAAYERQLRPEPTSFDEYIDTLGHRNTHSPYPLAAKQGLKLFIGKAQCINCHNGPLLTNFDFHNTFVSTLPEAGRFDGASLVVEDEFNCWSTYSDASDEQCEELDYIKIDDTSLLGAFKTPSLRHISKTAPYMHNGRFESLTEVIQHYNTIATAKKPAAYGHNELKQAINLTPNEIADLEAFLNTL